MRVKSKKLKLVLQQWLDLNKKFTGDTFNPSVEIVNYEAFLELQILENIAKEQYKKETKGRTAVFSHYVTEAYSSSGRYKCECGYDEVLGGSNYCSNCGYKLKFK